MTNNGKIDFLRSHCRSSFLMKLCDLHNIIIPVILKILK